MLFNVALKKRYDWKFLGVLQLLRGREKDTLTESKIFLLDFCSLETHQVEVAIPGHRKVFVHFGIVLCSFILLPKPSFLAV